MANERLPLGRLHGQDNSSLTNHQPNHQQGIVRDRRAFACDHLASKRAVFINSHSQGEGIRATADTFKDTGRLVGANLTAALRRHADSQGTISLPLSE